MLDEGVCGLLGEENPIQAWKKLIKPNDIVGIKSNSWFNLPTPKELQEAIQQRVMDAGVSKNKISIDDRGLLSNPIFKSSTALINVRPLRTHHWSGIGGCIKNNIMFVSSPWAYHGEACSPLASIWNQPLVKGKTRLNILSLIRTQFYNRGAHHFDRSMQLYLLDIANIERFNEIFKTYFPVEHSGSRGVPAAKALSWRAGHVHRGGLCGSRLTNRSTP